MEENIISVNTYRCKICLLIPKIINIKYNNLLKNLISLLYVQIIIMKDLISMNIKLLIDFHWTQTIVKSAKKNNYSKYYCKECFLTFCEECNIIHKNEIKHNKIASINDIDTNCFLHNEKQVLYCKNCETNICNKCLKENIHKNHEINELKFINFEKIKKTLEKFKLNIPKYYEKVKQKELKYINKNLKIKKLQLENDYQILKQEKLDIIDFLLLLIEDYEKFKIKDDIYPNFNLISNIKILNIFFNTQTNNLGHFMELDYKEQFCKNYEEVFKPIIINHYFQKDFKFFKKKI